MTLPDVPSPYQANHHTGERYREGWQDGRAGRPHAHAEHANEIIRQQGHDQYEAYSAGHTAGREAERLAPGWLVWAHQRLDELEQAPLAGLPAAPRAELAARLSAMAATLTNQSAANPPAAD